MDCAFLPQNYMHPKISILTPSFNQARFLEQTISSVREQDYPNIEHIVVDGGSSDGTIDILRKHTHVIWKSERDHGQADALNKAFALSTGDIIGWINSDDYYEQNVFGAVVAYFSDPLTMWLIGTLGYVDEHGSLLTLQKSPQITYQELLRDPDIVRQPPAFFRRQVIERAGKWNVEYYMGMDYDLWVRIAKLYTPRIVDKRIANFRLHSLQKSSLANLQRQTREICRVLSREGANPVHIFRLYLTKQWYAFKARCKNALLFLGILHSSSHSRSNRGPLSL